MPDGDGKVTIRGESFGVPFDVVVQGSEPGVVGSDADGPLLDAVRTSLPPGWRARAVDDVQPAATFAVVAGPTGTAVTVDGTEHPPQPLAPALHLLDAGIRAEVSLHAPGLVFVHAGVVAGPGGALLLPGRSFAGKTTLVAALLRAGATYLSDEYAVLDPTGAVLPFPRRLSVRGAGSDRTEVPPAELGATVADGPHRVVGIAALAHDRAAGWSVVEGEASEAAMALIDNAVAARSRPAQVLAASAAAARGAWFLRGTRDEAALAAARLLDRLRSPAPATSVSSDGEV